MRVYWLLLTVPQSRLMYSERQNSFLKLNENLSKPTNTVALDYFSLCFIGCTYSSDISRTIVVSLTV